MAYGSVASLMRTMESVLQSPMQSLISDHKEEFLALREKIISLEVFLKKFEEGNNSGEMIDLEARIKEAANAVEHVIQLRLAESLSASDEIHKKEARERLCSSLEQVAEEIDRIYRESTNFHDKGKQALKKPVVQYSSSEKEIPDVNKNNMVGRDDERKMLIKDLTRRNSRECEVTSIVGMGGNGKTTLAKEVYNDASIRSHFDICAWATVSQCHNVKEILLSLLSSTKGEKSSTQDESELRDLLRKSLMGNRFLIVMDDMWSSQAWDDVRQCFPCENKGSWILLTARNTEVAGYASRENLHVQMDFMNSDDSWNLFESAAFANENLPSELKSIGKQIVDKCRGLPLTIVVVAGLLSKSGRTVEEWENVSENLKAFVTNDPDEQCLRLLGLSYNHLPGDLKACLLYFGVFSEDEVISVKRLLRLWIAEGLLKFGKDLEAEAEKCLQDLIDRCLVLVNKKTRDETKIKSCKVHDLIYEMCLREAESRKFFIMNEIALNKDGAQSKGSCRALLSLGRTCSIFSFREYHFETFTLPSELTHFTLLRILDLRHILLSCFPLQILCLIWLRYLALRNIYDAIPLEICRLWNLQIFIAENWHHPTIFTEQIWELTQLRHLGLDRFYFPNPPSVSVEEEKYFGFPEVHTIKGLSPSSCTKEVISGIRNVKKLGIYGNTDDYESIQESALLNNLVHLHQLGTLSFMGIFAYRSTMILPSAKAFPETLKKLKLEQTELRWEDLNIIGELPNLEVLKLLSNGCKGEEWHPVVGGFARLKLLIIIRCNFKYWKATNDNFPVLERVFIEECIFLEEIPLEFVDIDSLQLIDLTECHPKLEAYVIRIQQEQQDLGNNPTHARFNRREFSSRRWQ